jgi:hypothetical protein
VSWQSYEPPTVPSGKYIATIKADPVEKVSQFSTGRTYSTVELQLQAEDGQFFLMEWAWTPKMYIYKQLLMILGGKEQPSGHITPPVHMIGRKFKAKIIERPAKNDKMKLVNEIVDVSPYEEPKEELEEEPEKEADGEKIPF